MDIVYNCRYGSNEELRYSIRSAVANMPHDNLWVAGGKPDWYEGSYLEVPKNTKIIQKVDRENRSLQKVAECEALSKDIIFMHDDFYIIKKIDTLPIWHGGSLADKVREYSRLAPHGSYTQLLTRTFRYIVQKLGIDDPIDYELHIPMVMNREKMAEALTHGLLVRSIYGNLFNIGGEYHKDVKVYKNGDMMIRSFQYEQADSPYLSSIDGSFPSIYDNVLKDMFPDPSPYERP